MVVSLLALSSTACRSPRAIPLPAPQRAQSPAEFPAALVLSSLSTSELPLFSDEEADKRHERLRKDLVLYLRSKAQFTEVYENGAPPHLKPGQYVSVEVDVQFDQIKSRTWALDILTLLTAGLWPVSPQWGEAIVSATMTARDAEGREVAFFSSEKRVPFTLIFFTMYRTSAIDRAYESALAQVFEETAVQLTKAKERIVARLELDAESGERPKLVFVARDIGSGIASSLASALQRTGRYQVITPADVDRMIEVEANRDLLGCDDVSCFSEIAAALDADKLLVVRGAGWRDQSRLRLTWTLMNRKDMAVEVRHSAEIPGKPNDNEISRFVRNALR
jgi:hypothetical protein